MPVSGGFEQCYNAQALVDNDSLLIVAAHVTPNANDKKELKPALAAPIPESLGPGASGRQRLLQWRQRGAL